MLFKQLFYISKWFTWYSECEFFYWIKDVFSYNYDIKIYALVYCIKEKSEYVIKIKQKVMGKSYYLFC